MKGIFAEIASMLLVVFMLVLTANIQTVGAVTQGFHGLAVVEVAPSKTVVGQGYGLQVDVTVSNRGDYPEELNVTLYANATTIATLTGKTLLNKTSVTVDFSWDTADFAKGNYTLSAYAEPVLGETNTANNYLTGGWVVVAIAGDLTGGTDNVWDFVPDGNVDLKDTAMVAWTFYSVPGDPQWNPNCDINNDGRIDSKDMAVIGKNFGEVQSSARPATPINKTVIVYGLGWSDSDTTFAAQHFALVDTDFGHSTAMQSLKIKNPNVRVVGYKEVMMYTYLDDWAEVNSHEDWFVHDASGNRIKSTGWNWYLMNIGSAGYRQHWISHVNSKLGSQPGYDGVFADDVWNTIADYMLSSFDKTVPSSVISRWHNDMIGFLQYAKANLLSGRILVTNSDEWNGIDYISITDGEMIEGFAHASWGSGASYDRPSIDVLARKCATGKIVWAASGIDGGAATQTQIDAMLKYCYASFLVGMSGSNAYWSWTSTGGAIYNDLHGAFQPIMDTNIGQPTDTYYRSQNVYMRDFTGGKAIVNPSSSTSMVNLGGTYKLLNGTTVSSITLNSHNGEILLSPT